MRKGLLCGLAVTAALGLAPGGRAQSDAPLPRLPNWNGTRKVYSSLEQQDALRRIEMLCELDWLADSLTFPCPLQAKMRDGWLEVHGTVANRSARDRALTIARRYHPAVKSGVGEDRSLQPRLMKVSPQYLERAAARALEQALPHLRGSFTLEGTREGRLIVTGLVDSDEARWLVSQTLRRVPGCSSVRNRLDVGAATTSPYSTGYIVMEEEDPPVTPPPVAAPPVAPPPVAPPPVAPPPVAATVALAPAPQTIHRPAAAVVEKAAAMNEDLLIKLWGAAQLIVMEPRPMGGLPIPAAAFADPRKAEAEPVALASAPALVLDDRPPNLAQPERRVPSPPSAPDSLPTTLNARVETPVIPPPPLEPLMPPVAAPRSAASDPAGLPVAPPPEVPVAGPPAMTAPSPPAPGIAKGKADTADAVSPPPAQEPPAPSPSWKPWSGSNPSPSPMLDPATERPAPPQQRDNMAVAPEAPRAAPRAPVASPPPLTRYQEVRPAAWSTNQVPPATQMLMAANRVTAPAQVRMLPAPGSLDAPPAIQVASLPAKALAREKPARRFPSAEDSLRAFTGQRPEVRSGVTAAHPPAVHPPAVHPPAAQPPLAPKAPPIPEQPYVTQGVTILSEAPRAIPCSPLTAAGLPNALKRRIQAVCGDKATVHNVSFLSTSKLLIDLEFRFPEHAERVARQILDLPEMQMYEPLIQARIR